MKTPRLVRGVFFARPPRLRTAFVGAAEGCDLLIFCLERGFWGHIRCCGWGLWRFRSYSESLFQTPECRPSKKEPKGLAPGVRHFAEAQCSLATVFIRGHRLRFASLHLLSMYAATPHGAARLPRMNTFARPADGGENQKPDQKQIKRSQPSAAPTGRNGGEWRILERLL